MKKIVLKISKKKLIGLAVAFFIIVAGAAAYTAISINRNLHQMDVGAKEITYNFPTYPAVNTAKHDAATIARGEYLAKAGDCIACHTNTPDKKAGVYAGGLPMHTPFGTIYSPNITPDKETGIGNWTEAQFITAMRKGISPKGHYYYPAFPYYYFNKITTEDLKALKAYFDSIPAIKQPNRPAEMMMPFDQRFLQLGWRELFFTPAINQDVPMEDPKQSALWNRGAYLVEGLGHCAMCHSPSYHIISETISLGAPIKKYSLTGAKIQGYLAPNISKSNLSTTSLEEIIAVFTEDKLIGGGKVEGPMVEVNHNSLAKLNKEDQTAIATYLKTVVSESPKRSSEGGVGGGIYESYCAGCHATGAGGAPRYGDTADWDPILKNDINTVYQNAIHGIAGMPAKGTCNSCTETEIKQAVDYIVSSVRGGAGTTVIKASKPKALSMNDGKHIYEANCGVCHNTGFKGAPIVGDQTAWKPYTEEGFYAAFKNVWLGKKGHLPHGGCKSCDDAELKAAVKYIMQQGDPNKNYELW